ncbi:hypothetical protein [Mycobacterium sp. 1274761.0]|uniref:hypothetical protein n=1 Tax=Mycobacterium sp. 1274761.0 TaxID=1834077 RepID=UPI0007FCD7FD|nr:hypothetical protein [Mycobacterium sp. 1274761.0]OBK77835.1 hypothetical protein A5651_03405 [Mycobacterium sp. 1274761.0]
MIYVVLWPFWLLCKFLGVRWVAVIKRDGHDVGRELVRGWHRSKRRVDEIVQEVAEYGVSLQGNVGQPR